MTPQRKLNGIERLLLWLYVLPFAFDFRGDAGGTTIQYALAAISLLSGGALVAASLLVFPKYSNHGSALRTPVLLWWIFIAGTLFSALVNAVPLDRYGRVILPFLLAGMSMLIVQCCARRMIDPRELVWPLVTAAAISTFWIVAHQVVIQGADPQAARYRLISVVFVVIVGFALSELLARKRLSAFLLILSISVIAVVAIALTRGAAVSLLAMYLGYLVLKQRLMPRFSIVAIGKSLAIIAAIVGLGLLAASEIRPDILERWKERIGEEKTTQGTQITLLTRVAEYKGQLVQWSSSAHSMLIGRGIGSTYQWDWRFIGELAKYFPKSARDPTTHWFAGHGILIYSLYAGGLVFGWIVPWIFFASLFYSYRTARTNVRELPDSASATKYFTLLVLLGFAPISLIANPFWLRIGGLTLGFLFAFAWWLQSRDLDDPTQIRA